MASGLESNGIDLDLIFAAYTSPRNHAGATNIKLNGVDLNQRYDSVAYGPSPGITGILANGTDINVIFCALGKNMTASLPSFTTFTSTPQTGSMTVTITAGVGPFTFSWGVTGDGTANGSIVSGQGTNSINWSANCRLHESGTVDWSCKVTQANGYSFTATTSMFFNVP